tara:strand:+ start:869 stop:1063 length:195 start_codon:yes stop_codon:yes gene_type:complete
MANSLSITIGATYKLENGDTVKLINLEGSYFIVKPIQTSQDYSTRDDGTTAIKALTFSTAKILE